MKPRLASSARQQPTQLKRGRLQIAACHRCLQERALVWAARPPPPPRRHRPSEPLRAPNAATQQGRQESRAVPDAPPAATSSSQQGQQRQQVDEQQAATAAEQQPPPQQEHDSLPVRAALGFLRFYKMAISPALPPACRYLPTCSVYAMEAFKTKGFWRGSVLTTWRLMRCAPWGGRGYDPVTWPPPGLEFLFKA